MRRRDFLKGMGAGAALASCPGCALPFGGSGLARPSARQLAWHEQELGMFFHFDIPIWKQGWNWRSWKDSPSPSLYNPTRLDTDQWMEAARAMGAKYVVLVAKHCSGFLQWQSDLYDYGVRQSPWRGGKGDLVRDFTDSARRYGLKPGLYASVSANGWLGVDNPGLVNRGKGGDAEAQRRYARVCERMAEELWTRYGELFEIWFDGGALPPDRGGPDLVPILERHQPGAILFQGPTGANNLIRWVGNERGVAPYPCWGATNTLTAEGGDAEGRFPGDPEGRYWAPGECDVPVRRHAWFWDDESKPHAWRYWTDAELMDMYERSVGRNCNLLLNANPNTDGLVPETDFAQYRRFGAAVRARFGHPFATAGGAGDVLPLALPAVSEIDRLVIQEDISEGHRIRAYRVEGERPEGGFTTLCSGSCVGHKRIETFAKTAVRSLRLVIETSVGRPVVRQFAAFRGGRA